MVYRECLSLGSLTHSTGLTPQCCHAEDIGLVFSQADASRTGRSQMKTRTQLKFWARFFSKAVMPAIPPCDRFSLKVSGPFPQATETGCERGTAFRICFLQCLSPQDQYLGQACSMVHCRVSSIPSRASSSGPSQTSRYPRITRSSLFRCRTIRMPSLPTQRNTH